MEEWLDRLRKWCSIQERCTLEARRKILQWGGTEVQAEQAISQMQDENFIAEDRFIEAYVRGHVEYKMWGPHKVIAGLRSKGISTSEAQRAMDRVPRKVILDGLNHLAQRRASELQTHRERVIRFLMSKGYNLQDILDSLAALTSR